MSPKEYPNIIERLERSKLVFIIGDPGIGKTYTAVKLLWDYYEKGYEPIWFTGLERTERLIQRQTLENFHLEKKQIIYFEDPFGRTEFDRRVPLSSFWTSCCSRLQILILELLLLLVRKVFERFVGEKGHLVFSFF